MTSKKIVKDGMVLKTMVIRMTHCKKMEAGSKGSLEAGMAEFNKLLCEEAISRDQAP